MTSNSQSDCEILSENFLEVVIVGGGTCGLAVAARLCESSPGTLFTDEEHSRFRWLRKRGGKTGKISNNFKTILDYSSLYKLDAKQILALDAVSDSFLGQWDNQFASCQIPTLRSPMFFHPDPANIDGMITYAHHHHREKDLLEIQNVVGKEFSKHQQKRIINKRKKKMAAPIAGQITNHDRPGIVDINMRDYRDYYRPSTNFFRDFCEDIIKRYDLGDRIRKDEVMSVDYGDINIYDEDLVVKGFIIKTKSGKVYGARRCVMACGHRGNINYPIQGMNIDGFDLTRTCHTTHIFSKQVQFPPEVALKKAATGEKASVVIVGGGLTSAQLAHICCKCGLKVTLLLRGPMKIKHFDFHLDWVTKYKNVKKSAFYMLDTDEERFDLINSSREGGSVNPEYFKLLAQHESKGNLSIQKFTTIKESCCEDGCWHLTLAHSQGEVLEESHMETDYICCATGISADIENLSFMKPILEKFPIDIVKGLPCLTDDLQWNETLPLYVVGKYSGLRIGPTAANLDGARLGAERVGWKIQEDCQLGRAPQNTQLTRQLELAGGRFNWFSLLQEVQA